MSDDSTEQLTIEVPYAFVLDQASVRQVAPGVTEWLRGEPTLEPQSFRMMLGEHDAGVWVCEGIEVLSGPDGARYLARIRRLS